jgi:hypothetical protein
MAIKGHKERALLRRGYHVQEALKRRPNLNETSFLRRNLISEGDDRKETLKLTQLCGEDIARNIKDSVYCHLAKLLDELPQALAEETYKAIDNLYNFFKPIKKDNRVVFIKTIKAILKNENPGNSLRLISKFLTDPDFDKDDVKKALINFRNEESVPQDQLEDFLKKARFKEYSKYEESFSSNNFDLLRGGSKLNHGQINPETGKSESFFKMVRSVYEGNIDVNLFIDSVSNAVLNTDISDLLYKSDLKVKNDLMVGEDVIIPQGSSIEVKKFDYEIDSYFSEYFAIYKNSSIPEIAQEEDFKELYNMIIDGIFKNVQEKGQFMINKIADNVDGIMYDKNIIVLKKDIEFYWSNKGQRSCDERRLSIRFKIINPNVTAYTYDSKTHSNQLTPLELDVAVKPKVFCQ